MNNTRSKKKLIPYKTLEELHHTYTLGVPLAQLVRQLDNTISSPTLKALIGHYEVWLTISARPHAKLTADVKAIYDSLFPDWLNLSDGAPQVQLCPNGVLYIGTFPYGDWIYND